MSSALQENGGDVTLGDRAPRIRPLSAAMACASLAVALMAAPAVTSAAPVDAPHIVTETNTDTCAMCHRAHTAASDAEWEDPLSLETTGAALLAGLYLESGDIGLCYTCHGVDALGSGTDVETAFLGESTHSLMPDPSPYGPSEKQCATCHDSHGSQRDTDGEPYAALLRSQSATEPTQVFYGGDAYCASCHLDRTESVWDGLKTWRQTVHASRIAAPASGTRIVCSACHSAHGSETTPLIAPQLLPPSAPATASVPANDRRLCFGCHAGSYGTFDGEAAYADSGHATSEATVPVSAEWGVALGAERAVGECQTCHDPMGRSDGAGGVVPKLAYAEGRALCDGCHREAGPAATDLASLAFPPAATTLKELAVSYDPDALASSYSRVAVYSADTTGAAPRTIIGPREFDVTSRAGDVASGDIDGDGTDEFLVADPGAARVEVLAEDPLSGLERWSASVDADASFVALGDVFLDGSGLPEVIVVSRGPGPGFASDLYVYRHNGTTLTKVEGPVAVGNDASGLAVGRLTRGDRDDIVVTAAADNELYILRESATPGTLDVDGPHGTRRGPRGPSIGDAWDGSTVENEVVIANSGEVTGTVSVFDTSGTILGSYDATANAGARAWDTLVADVLPGVGGEETVVALRHASGTSGVNVYQRTGGGGLGNRQSYDTGAYYNSGSLAAGDVDADGDDELVVGNGGTWSRDGTRKEPSVQVFSANATGDGLASPTTLWGGGAELAGAVPGVAIADVGAFGESRHPVGAVADTHISTETATVERHVECVDCHDVHEATSTPTVASGVAPDVYGPLTGAWGVKVENAPPGSITLTERRGVLYEYELCLKCHSAWSDLEGGRDIASEVDTRNASVHAVEETPTAAENTDGSFESTSPAWSSSSVLYCVDCHGNADPAQAPGPHRSTDSPILLSPYLGQRSSAQDLLCYVCHKYTVYFTGTDDRVAGSTSRFYDDSLTEPKLHKLHVDTRGYGCQACHVSHGVDREHLIRGGVGYTHAAGGGSCDNACHSGGSNAYTR